MLNIVEWQAKFFAPNKFQKSIGWQQYNSNRIGGLTAWLAKQYPMAQKSLGHRCFQELAEEYIANFEPYASDTEDYGELFPEFLFQRQGQTEIGLSYIKDIARLDRLKYQSYYAKNRAINFLRDFQEQATEQQCESKLLLSDDIKVMSSNWPLLAIQGDLSSEKQRTHFSCTQHLTYFLIERPHLKVITRPISRLKYNLIKALSDGISINRINELMPEALKFVPDLIENGEVGGFKIVMQ